MPKEVETTTDEMIEKKKVLFFFFYVYGTLSASKLIIYF